MHHRLTFAAALLVLAACSQEVPAAPAPPPAASPVPVTAAPALAASNAGMATAAQQASPPAGTGVAFSVTVQSTNCSGAPTAVAQVQWDATAAKSTGVAVYVEAPGNPRKLWVEGGAAGKDTTGPWVFPQTRFTLMDKASGTELSSQLVGALVCP